MSASLRTPPVVTGKPEDWDAHLRAAWSKLPAWGFDRGYVAELAADHLPRVLAQMGLGQLLGRVSPDAAAIVGKGAPWAALPMDPGGRWMLFRLEPDSATLITLDSWAHAWRCPELDQFGADLIDLGAWRWATSPAKAAFRIARICGRARPVP